ncbi:hypothetical protein NI389_12370 [Pseudoalteromonas xiamenensis]|uniref:hypothetical protein n=1 Tax=Pseudoalteromonas xiamenensis TaxID=882626 RepID=UPI0027E4AE70|nr:hypothetical protein [Pseudoalteromonas xiamenensis]WMN59008.1 hypothetical protein NI389_12370 [Pseudoalteromonas xiamenensis]
MKHTLLALTSALVISQSVFADEQRSISKTFSQGSSHELAIEFPVGQLDIQTTEGENIEINVVLKPKTDDSWFSKNVELDTIEIESKQRGSELYLTIDNDEIQQEWSVKVPKSMALDIELGVGNVEVESLANSADIEVGVGKVRINSHEDDFRSIALESGVGKSHIKGFENNIEYTKNMVSSDMKYRGQGKYTIKVEIGVGDAKFEKI